MPNAWKPKLFSWARLILILLAGALFLWGGWKLVWQVGFGLPGDADFYLQHNKYQNIVAHIKVQHLAPGAKMSEWVDGDHIEAERNRSGSYAMTITTVDWDHAGVYGYVFSDTPLTMQPNENYPDSLGVDNPGGMPFVDKGILGQGGHWWSVYNNLM